MLLSDIFDTELFNPSEFTLDLPDYLDQFPITDFSSSSFFPTSSSSSLSSPSPFLIDSDNPIIGIDPQLVDTPSAVTDHGDEDDSELDDLPPSTALLPTTKPTITIPPISSTSPPSSSLNQPTAHKSRKGTVFSGGIVKKSSHAKENDHSTLSSGVAAAKKTAATKHARNMSVSSSVSSFSGLPTIAEDLAFSSFGRKAPSEDDIDDQELPQDWRPSPDVLAKMTSKEKRQLRNKISARNFRIRRKEYISTLEGDIAERDRLLDHFRTQLGSRESENVALRQEIAALKDALLQGRGLDPSALTVQDSVRINLPPPKMLPEQSAAEAWLLSENASFPNTTPLLTPNTQKDLPTSRLGSSSSSNAFWGGVGMGSGITPVHTTLMPDMSVVLRRALMENINPSLNRQQQQQPQEQEQQAKGTPRNFEGFADAHPFTLKTIDAYRMHLWGKMAAQQQSQAHQPSPSSSRTSSPSPPASPYYGYYGSGYNQGLADRLRPHFFSPSSSGSGLLGKHSGSSSSSVVDKSIGNYIGQETQQQQQVLIAAMASQTMLKKLGSAFWDAFVGSSSSSSPSSISASTSTSNWDSDKVKRVLEGKAVLKVVDVEPLPPSTLIGSGVMIPTTTTTTTGSEKCERKVCELLEESMRSLTIGKKG